MSQRRKRKTTGAGGGQTGTHTSRHGRWGSTPFPSTPTAGTSNEEHIQHANPKEGQGRKICENTLDGNGATSLTTPALRHNRRPKSNPRRNLDGEGRAVSSPNVTIPKMQSSPLYVPPPDGKIEEGCRGTHCATEALQGTRNRQHSFFNRRRTKFHESEHHANGKRWLQQTRREVGKVRREVRMRVFKSENANQQGQGERTGGET